MPGAMFSWRDVDKFPWSLPLGSIFRIPVRLHITFFILLLAQTLGSIYYGGWYVLLFLILMGPVLLVTILVHELGHCLAARSIGGTVDSILLWPLGGLAFMTYNTTYKKAIWVAAAGPLTHLPMVGIWLLLLLPAYYASTGSLNITLQVPYVDAKHLGQALCALSIIINISLFVFNLFVPAYPLDGGRIFTILMLMAGVSMRTTAIITVAFATVIAAGLIAFGIIKFQMVTILVAVFILLSTFMLFRAIRQDKLAEHPLFASVSAEGGGTAAAGGGGAAAAGASVASASGGGVNPRPSGKSGASAPAGSFPGASVPSGAYPGYPGTYTPPAYPPPGYPQAGQPPPGYPTGGPPYSGAAYYSGNAV